MVIGKRWVTNGVGEPDSITDFGTCSEAKGCVRKVIYDFEEVRTTNKCDDGFFGQIT